MQRLKTIYPEYEDAVDFYAVGFSESLETLDKHNRRQGYPWPVAVGQGRMIRDLNVTYQSTKIAFDADGVVIYRHGFGDGDADRWRQVFEQLAASR